MHIVKHNAATPEQSLDMLPQLAPGLDALADWRLALERDLGALEGYLADSDLLAPAAAATCRALRQRLTSDKLVVAFVAEFSRGKSELINAIFFADSGRRILPATPGRTTMCPVELCWDGEELPTLDLLPIDTRQDGGTLAEWRDRREQWQRVQLDPDDADGLAAALAQVTQVRKVTREYAKALSLWSDEQPSENPPVGEDGLVEVPAWRHAIINFPHPLLQRGLVVVDTPGLNAIGAEPELTLGLLPSAHAALFVLGADTGVTKSDLEVWTDHLGGQGLSCFVVLNKMDTLADPLATPEEQAQAVERQCQTTASTLGIPRQRVFPVSARQALAARLMGDAPALAASRLPELEAALNADLLPQRQRVLATAVISGVASMLESSTRRLRDQRRANADQMLELRGLRGKSAGRVATMLERVGQEQAELEECANRLKAMRLVHAKMNRAAMQCLESDRIRESVLKMQESISSGWFNLGARTAFAKMCTQLRELLDNAQKQVQEVNQMLQALFNQLNSEFAFTLGLTSAPDLGQFKRELELIERSYNRYFSVTRAMRLNSPAYSEQFQRMLVSKLRVVFENASNEIESWNQLATQQIDGQFKERRHSFKRRRESLERIQQATDGLEQRLAEVEVHDARLLEQLDRAQLLAAELRGRAERGPVMDWPQAEPTAA
ncbi:dynamin family protein [Ideonella livida]|uniref:Dynamin family protein n=1 Tax=Ideonella livida TaxID=2707176 RepID=A0A7C9TL72_9BURK|nr:dynamin family protein [Ideonella livida]NDY92264.1 dynamin family protein [Ideonella livida]